MGFFSNWWNKEERQSEAFAAELSQWSKEMIEKAKDEQTRSHEPILNLIADLEHRVKTLETDLKGLLLAYEAAASLSAKLSLLRERQNLLKPTIVSAIKRKRGSRRGGDLEKDNGLKL